MTQNGVVANKIHTIRETLRELRGLTASGPLTTERLQQDSFLRRGVERSLQICVEALVDIALRLLSLLGEPPPPSGGKALDRLEQRGLIASAATYKQTVQFRDLVVHRYEAVDTAVLVDLVNQRLDDLDQFIGEIARAQAGPG
jgi:uncharacterized protein YutE (UPF0331/DUF86 family)